MPRKLLRSFHPEGIPWPASILYNAISRSDIFRQHYALVAKDIAHLAPLTRILDIGTGPARLLMALHRRLPRTSLCGIDISNAMVATAQRNIQRECPLADIEMRVGNAESLPFEENSFDCVVSTGSLHHWKHPVRALNEIHRVLKAGQSAFIYDLVRQMPKSVARAARRQFGSYRMVLLWLHSFEEPFLNDQEMLSLAAGSAFKTPEIRYTGALCGMILTK